MSLLQIESDALAVSVNPGVGGTITDVRHRASGLSVLGRVPWNCEDSPLPSLAARDEPEWLTRYTGGWPLLFPNAGDAATVDGVFHGFHGEASIAPWHVVEQRADALVLERRFAVIPALMRRTMTVDGDTLTMAEEVTLETPSPADVMWGHHPSFGSDLLDGPFEITCGATDVRVEPLYDPPANPLRPGATGRWPTVAGKDAVSDLRRPLAPCASLAYLEGFDQPWAAIRRLDDAVAIVLTWDGARFPCAWLWCELCGTRDEPWGGRTRLVAIEPNTTACSLGLNEARRRGLPLLRLLPGKAYSASIALRVFTPSGPITTPETARPS
ncbi:MAG: hypothetical protein IOC86_01555 [Aestuariivirga sp.]|nr:hypothetical protein [Aestuariivirga sp.]